MPSALTRVDLLLQFSTSQPEALLLLAAGQADHLLLQLHSGRLQVSGTPGNGARDPFCRLEGLVFGCATSCESPLPSGLGLSTAGGQPHPRVSSRYSGSAYRLSPVSLLFVAPSWPSGLGAPSFLCPSPHSI